MNRTIAYDLFDLPQDYLFKYINTLAKVSTDGVLEAAQKHVHPEVQQIIVVADAAKTEDSLKELGIPIRRLVVD